MTVEEILKATGGSLVFGDPRTRVGDVSLDSRTLTSGALFIAIRGKRLDGHDFVAEALSRGAAGCVLSRPVDLPQGGNGRVEVRVEDTVDALQRLGRYQRKRLGPRVVAVTGSNGKTTTKDFIYSLLRRRFPAQKTEGTKNNQIGLPLTLLNLNGGTRVAVVELGMNAPGEIALLTSLALPDVGIITNIGPAHVEFLGSVEGVARAKAELLEGMGEDSCALLNGDDPWTPYLRRRVRGRLALYTIEGEGEYALEDVREGPGGARFRFRVHGVSIPCSRPFPLPGRHNLYNFLAAAAAAVEVGLSPEEACAGAADLRLPPMRFEEAEVDGVRLLNDAYNANPASVEAALAALKSRAGDGRGIPVLGDMLELGRFSVEAHLSVGRLVARLGLLPAVFVGNWSGTLRAGVLEEEGAAGDVYVCGSKEEAAEVLAEILRAGDTVLFKASRLLRFEEILDRLQDAASKGWSAKRER